MKCNNLNYYFFDRLKCVEQNLYAYKKDMNPERMHILRVEIKKVKGLISFVECTCKEKNDINKLKPLFKEAGDIRELEINILLLSALPQLPEELIIQLEEKEKILVQQFIANNAQYIDSVQRFREEISLPNWLPDEKTIKNYFKKKISKANNKLPSNDRIDMHHFRIEIKEIMYVYNALPKKLQKSVKLNKTYIDKLQIKAGDWHDTYVAIDYLSQQQFPQQVDEYISKLNEKESNQFNELLQYRKKHENAMIK